MTQSDSEHKSRSGKPDHAKSGHRARSRRSSKKRRKPRKPQGGPTPSKLDEAIAPIVAAFMGCGRCSFFLAAYRALLGKEAFIAQVGSSEDDWVELPWRPELVELIEKSYGIRLDDGLFFLEHACRECGRVLTYERTADEDGGEATGQPPDVRIQILGDG